MKIIIIGQGGHSKVIQDIVLSNENMKVFGFLDDKFKTFSYENGMYIGPVKSALELVKNVEDIKFVIGIGQNRIREKIVEALALEEKHYVSLVHSTACISPRAQIGHGTVIMAHAVINADVKIGNHAIINTGAIIEHDCIVADFAHISPNATLTGTVRIGQGAHIGAGATIIPTVKIGEWSVIGAGATVINHIPAHCTAVGIPAKVKMKEGDNHVQYYA